MRTTKVDRKKVIADLAVFDWSKIDSMTDLDIARQVAANPDAPPMLSPEDIANLRSTGRARVVRPLDVRAVRSKTGLSQERFAASFGISVATLRNWEQGRRQPEGPARALLMAIDAEPKTVMRAIAN